MIQTNKNVVFVPSSVVHLTSTPQLFTSNSNSLTTNSNIVQQPNAQTYLVQNQPAQLILTPSSSQIYLNPSSSHKSTINHSTKEQSGHSGHSIASINSQPFLFNQLPVLTNSSLILQNKVDSQNADKITFLQSNQSNQKSDHQFQNQLYHSYALSNLIANRNLLLSQNANLNASLNSVQSGQHLIVPSSILSSSNSAIQTTTTTKITKNVDKIVTRYVDHDEDNRNGQADKQINSEIDLQSIFDNSTKKVVNFPEDDVKIRPFIEPINPKRSSSPDLMIIESRSNIEKARRGRKLHSMSEKMFKNQQIKQVKKERRLNPRMIIQKSTKQMNNELLMKSEENGNEESVIENTDTDQMSSGDQFRQSNEIDASSRRQKKKAIVKPQVTMNHLVEDFLIQESKRKFSPNHQPIEKNKDDLKTKLIDSPLDRMTTEKEKLKKLKSTLPNDQSILKAKQRLEQNAVDSTDDPKVSHSKRGIYKWTVDETFELVKHASGVETANQLKELKFDGFSLAIFDIGNLRSLGNFKLGPFLRLNEKVESFKKQSMPVDGNDYLPAAGSNIFKWSVEDVKEFVGKLCGENVNADKFEEQQIDGQSLTLINFDQIKNDLNVPYGQAIKIYHEIKRLKEGPPHC